MDIKYYLFVIVVYFVLLFSGCNGVNINRGDYVYRANTSKGMLSMISINLDTGIESCPCRIYNYCFSMFAYKSFVLFLAIFGVTLILATMVAAQRATKIPVKRSPKK
ncbi:conserved Plasmodium protein, unknown function [Plasmodium yoelii]|uniref:Uncharacterized protein n=1 Tax=Plasmodium yoelii TaxID=5861 RepID=A0A077Y5N8_PLAYE|nr:conserved Plasmodium protein, unknown function [Plasmodium yoelii]CDU16915.1 conserved Plasmodium protein, unknown function [Plasmodium yoelii]VTZ75204.1 conserved Plasmodium protein, unknown function [Plasmodium yoelii]|eukprot:XP_022813134.1 conserved Plasmodium protein, unknown function [Plasmodium yoelii]